MAEQLGGLNFQVPDITAQSGFSLADFSKKQQTINRSTNSTSTTTTNTSNVQNTTSNFSSTNKKTAVTYAPSTSNVSTYAPQIAYYSPYASLSGGTTSGASTARPATFLGGDTATQAATPTLTPRVDVAGGAAQASTGTGSGGFDFDMLILAGAAVAGIFVLTKL